MDKEKSFLDILIIKIEKQAQKEVQEQFFKKMSEEIIDIKYTQSKESSKEPAPGYSLKDKIQENLTRSGLNQFYFQQGATPFANHKTKIQAYKKNFLFSSFAANEPQSSPQSPSVHDFPPRKAHLLNEKQRSSYQLLLTFKNKQALNPGFTRKELKKIYKEIVFQIHPDRGGNGALLTKVTEAYQCLDEVFLK